jgi:NAD(P)-dependent dehydrogenase (short-subunit alcohol dehydrogenase family)
MHKLETYEPLKGLSPFNRLGEVKEIVDAVLFLTDATFTTGEILHVDGGAHAGKWQRAKALGFPALSSG